MILDRNPGVCPAWHDEDDDQLIVDLNDSENRLRKLNRKSSNTKPVTGSEMTTLLQER